MITVTKKIVPTEPTWSNKCLSRSFEKKNRCCVASISSQGAAWGSLHLPHRGEARLEGHAICGASAAGMKGAEQPQGSNWVIRVFTEHLRIEWNKMEQITILYHTFTIIYPSKSLDLPYIYHDLPLWIHDLRCVLWLKHESTSHLGMVNIPPLTTLNQASLPNDPRPKSCSTTWSWLRRRWNIPGMLGRPGDQRVFADFKGCFPMKMAAKNMKHPIKMDKIH